MIDLAVLERMDEESLRSWLLRRVRGETYDPPLSEMHDEAPQDYVVAVHGQTADGEFRARLETAVAETLRQAAKNTDLRSGPDAAAIRDLANTVRRLKIVSAAPVLRAVAERGAIGGAPSEIATDTEEAVLTALALVQPRGILRDHWQRLWQQGSWGVLPLTGLRYCDPPAATDQLPQAVRRAMSDASFPLGEVLWAWRSDPDIGASRLSDALRGLDAAQRKACAQALQSVGAGEGDVEDLLPEPVPASPAGPSQLPDWVTETQMTKVPSLRS